MKKIEIMATLWPDMDHFDYFSKHPRLNGIRLNTAMSDEKKAYEDFTKAKDLAASKDLYLDIKGRQLRVTEVIPNNEDLEIKINHKIEVETPLVIILRGGEDRAVLKEIRNGNHLIFDGGPKYKVKPGQSLNVRSNTLKVLGDLFTDQQLSFIESGKKAGIDKYMLSYVTMQSEIDEFRELVGPDVEIIAKIENEPGLKFARTFNGDKNTHLLTARGDLFVEVTKPHDILQATRDILSVDKEAILGSRILLSITNDPVPSCSDINEVAWLLEIGYRRFMFCDGLCLQKQPLNRAIAVLSAIADNFRS